MQIEQLEMAHEIGADKSSLLRVTLPKHCVNTAQVDARVIVKDGFTFTFRVTDAVLQSHHQSFTVGGFVGRVELNVTLILLCSSIAAKRIVWKEYMLEQVKTIPGKTFILEN